MNLGCPPRLLPPHRHKHYLQPYSLLPALISSSSSCSSFSSSTSYLSSSLLDPPPPLHITHTSSPPHRHPHPQRTHSRGSHSHPHSCGPQPPPPTLSHVDRNSLPEFSLKRSSTGSRKSSLSLSSSLLSSSLPSLSLPPYPCLNSSFLLSYPSLFSVILLPLSLPFTPFLFLSSFDLLLLPPLIIVLFIVCLLFAPPPLPPSPPRRPFPSSPLPLPFPPSPPSPLTCPPPNHQQGVTGVVGAGVAAGVPPDTSVRWRSGEEPWQWFH